MYFTITTASGGYRARLFGSNHKLVWWSEVYTTKAGAANAIALAKQAWNAPEYDQTT